VYLHAYFAVLCGQKLLRTIRIRASDYVEEVDNVGGPFARRLALLMRVVWPRGVGDILFYVVKSDFFVALDGVESSSGDLH
jgi:hypothetical protein